MNLIFDEYKQLKKVSGDPQIMRDIFPYFHSSILILLSVFCMSYTGNYLIPFWIIFLIGPSRTFLFKEDTNQVDSGSEKKFREDKRFIIPLVSLVFVSTTLWIWGMMVCSDQLPFKHRYIQGMRPQTGTQWVLFSVSMGVFCAVEIVAGHELMHNRNRVYKILGTWVYTKFLYSHFFDEHIQGHHKHIATPEDSATAKFGETVYHFVVKSIIGSHVNTWNRECKRIRKTHGDDAHIFLRNKMTWYFVLHVSILSLIYHFLGMSSLKYQFAYTVQGILYQETVNYIEHYGLVRKKDKNGVYESISRMHSWNQVSSTVMFRIQRHSDHHMHAFKPYQVLKRIDDAPTYPFDYNYAIVICLFPPLWFYCVNPRVQAIRDFQDQKKVDFEMVKNHDKKAKRLIFYYNLTFQVLLTAGAFMMF